MVVPRSGFPGNQSIEAARSLLGDPERSRRMGESGHERVRDRFLADRDLSQWMELLDELGLR